ncbi:GtrA family protein [Nocardia cyriacigeorgica]|uniref:GtrA family protein n=1 Tax=Nocardia cyriacigeorgica TaxID=135487 RepID=A0A6P1DBI9_9NOCA|nr:GtrA family protein [Nocardia cyriacigeorgica]NEW41647.1 GtrA family protein [Nocardia cyriacigeorgica]NEW48125.1 GtrA family protein [Nocardia cyriacigeorgica]NEW52279.1 GtrA family protein [Nocardia cyriacigeorgica]NEW59431.1 GtrA family protein [Nocardia cyriacigeorgica]
MSGPRAAAQPDPHRPGPVDIAGVSGSATAEAALSEADVPQPAVAGGQVLAADHDPGPLLRLVRRQELAFAVVGGFNTLLGIVLTVAWLAVLGDDVPPSVAVVVAYCLSVFVAFVLHRTLVFRVRGHLIRDFLAFVAVNSGGLLMNVVLLELAVTVLGFPDEPAAVVVMGFVAVVSFFGHRHISFRRRVG